jgi:mannose-6-phosphate isomerase-like protein (cupin superfamily)
MTTTHGENGKTTATRVAMKTGPREGEAYWFYGDLAVVRSPAGATPIVIEHHVGPGGRAPLHLHHRLEDSFYLLSGELALRCGDESFVVRAGDYVSLPRGVPHTLANVGDVEAVMLQTHTDSSFLDFIRAIGVPATQPRPEFASMDLPAMNAIAGQTGQPVVGPPMSVDEAAAIVAAGR